MQQKWWETMKIEQLEILLQEGEGTMLEYKESLSASFARELVALANTLGGRMKGVKSALDSPMEISDQSHGTQGLPNGCEPAMETVCGPHNGNSTIPSPSSRPGVSGRCFRGRPGMVRWGCFPSDTG
jgi:hypothetical protein